MEGHDGQQVEEDLPQPARAARRRLITNEDWFQAFKYIKTERQGFPLPKRAPKIEGTKFPFVKSRDATDSDLGDCLKRIVFGVEDIIGDTRRLILQLLPMNKKNRSQINTLSNQLLNLEAKLAEKIMELERDAGITLDVPSHFKKYPALEA